MTSEEKDKLANKALKWLLVGLFLFVVVTAIIEKINKPKDEKKKSNSFCCGG